MANDVLDCILECTACGARNLHIYVPVRTEGQDVRDWMEKVVLPTVGNAHYRFSPTCTVKKLDQLKIPISEMGIGFPLTGSEKPDEESSG